MSVPPTTTARSHETGSIAFRKHSPAGPSVVVGMSGGVDSAVAALLLVRAGYRVRGLFMKNWDEDDGTEYCTAMEDLADAERVCAHLGIELETANFAAEYWDNVFEHFLAEYAAGRTPNPDILCNREIKFRQFVDYASLLGADLIATGHYARGTWNDGRDPITALREDPTARSFRLLKGVDPGKDQSYFLQAVPRAQLARCLFPLGGLHKHQVRELARDAGLHNHRRKDSTGICFIGERRFRDFLQRYLPVRPGPIIDSAGNELGTHQGLAYYTIGQRQGLGIGGVRRANEAPWYVARKELATNTLVVTQDLAELESDWLVAGPANWLEEGLANRFDAGIRVRYRQTDQRASVAVQGDGTLAVTFHSPQRAVTPGQYVAMYRDEVCLGGAEILDTGRGEPP
jgi:tRNA-specific 2-thiouridylase